jgi:DNA-binding GntR family transcriptional regulator
MEHMAHVHCPGHAALTYPATVGYVHIDPLGERPVYLQLSDVLRERIASGELEPNRPLPSLTTLVQEYQVARGTASKAVQVLVGEGLVRIAPGKGAFVVRRS